MNADNIVGVDSLRDMFRYHAPRPDQVPRYEELREAAHQFAIVIAKHCPPSADRSAAIRKVREAVMTANASIALEPEPAAAQV